MSRKLSIRDIERMENTSTLSAFGGVGGTSGDIYCDLTGVIGTIGQATQTVIKGTDVGCTNTGM